MTRTAALAVLREEREALYAAIGDLDHDLETGKLSAADHAELRAELRARAIHLLREERAAGAEGGASAADSEMRAAASAEARAESAAPPPGDGAATPRCAACGFEAAQAHRFCAHCGAPLNAAPPHAAAAAPEDSTPGAAAAPNERTAQ